MTSAHNIILCNRKGDNIDLFKKEKPYIYTGWAGSLIYGGIMNPPFYNMIIINNNLIIKEKYIILFYNNIIVGGCYIVPTIYYHFFDKLNNETKKYHEYTMIIKKNNFIYPILPKRYIDCIIGGVQKAGTTSLLKNLSKHPDISSYPEEIHFFDILWSKGTYFYEKHFDYSKKITMEKTPEIIYLPHTYPLIQSLNPYVKFIIILRNPIHRAYSSWNMSREHKWTDETFEECIDAEIKYKLNENKIFITSGGHYLQKGLYYKQIMELLKFFPRQNIIILIFEELINNVENEYNKIYDFLNIPRPYNIKYDIERVGNYDNKISKNTYLKLKNFFKKDVRKLEKFLGYTLNWF
jgi:hypothetical protein